MRRRTARLGPHHASGLCLLSQRQNCFPKSARKLPPGAPQTTQIQHVQNQTLIKPLLPPAPSISSGAPCHHRPSLLHGPASSSPKGRPDQPGLITCPSPTPKGTVRGAASRLRLAGASGCPGSTCRDKTTQAETQHCTGPAVTL